MTLKELVLIKEILVSDTYIILCQDKQCRNCLKLKEAIRIIDRDIDLRSMDPRK